jgi:hypothetical protein
MEGKGKCAEEERKRRDGSKGIEGELEDGTNGWVMSYVLSKLLVACVLHACPFGTDCKLAVVS